MSKEATAIEPSVSQSDFLSRCRAVEFRGRRLIPCVGTSAALNIALIQALFLPPFAWAGPDRTTLCILRATESLPKVSGLKVKKSVTRPMPAEQLANWNGQSTPIVVDIDADAQHATQRYSYICATDPKGGTFVQRIAIPDLPQR